LVVLVGLAVCLIANLGDEDVGFVMGLDAGTVACTRSGEVDKDPVWKIVWAKAGDIFAARTNVLYALSGKPSVQMS
jgi:hypothetical protein